MTSLPKLPPNTLQLKYRPFRETIDQLADDDRKLFTVALGSRKDTTEVIMEDTTALTKRHKYDAESPEYKVARFTVQIRNFQSMFQANPKSCRGQNKSRCKEFIEKRHKYLTILKNQDIKKFEWVLQLLGIMFKPLPEVHEQIGRKRSLEKLTYIYCAAIRSKKMLDYKLELESQKIPFLEEKLATLRQIKADEESMRLPCSVDEEILDTIKRIETLKNNPVEIKPVEQTELVPTHHVPDSLYVIGETKTSIRY